MPSLQQVLGTGLKRSHFAEAEGDLAWGTSAAFHVTGCFVDTHGCPEAGYMETQLDTESCPDVGLARLCDMPGIVGTSFGRCGQWLVPAVYQRCLGTLQGHCCSRVP